MKYYTLSLILPLLILNVSAQENFALRLNNAAIELTRQVVKYNPGYFSIDYPNGDIPDDIGVCTDVITFFSRHGQIKKITLDPDDYLPGDIVAWDLSRGIPHIGIVVNQKSADNKRNLIVHNIGNGQEISDCLFSFKITGHFTYK